jgi:hypothetical protein
MTAKVLMGKVGLFQGVKERMEKAPYSRGPRTEKKMERKICRH